MQANRFELHIGKEAQTVMQALTDAGFVCYAVGGCVRDALLGKQAQDIDLTTDASPDEMKRVFADFKTADTGLKHGTLTVLCGGQSFEITTFRVDGSYSDRRRPDSVTFTRSLEEDLARRDFTVCAMAWSEKTGLVDLFSGQEDLAAKKIRCVGEPDRRFSEDALRILRGLRFASCLDFQIEEHTAASILKNASLLHSISVERVFSELLKLLCGKGAGRVLRFFSVVFAEILPSPTDWERTAQLVDASEAIPEVRLAVLLCESTAETAESTLRSLHADTKTIQTVGRLIKYHDSSLPPDRRAIKKRLSEIPPADFLLLQKLRLVLRPGDVTVGEVERLTEQILENKECFSIDRLAVNGRKLMDRLGLVPGRLVGEILEKLLDEVIEERLENSEDALLERAETLF